MALSHLLLAPPSVKLPAYIPLRRAAIDLIGRGFTVWEPYLDISKILLGKYKLNIPRDIKLYFQLNPYRFVRIMFGSRQTSAKYDLWPSINTSRRFLSNSKTCACFDSNSQVNYYSFVVYCFSVLRNVYRPAAFITTMAREVARYNTMQQNAQTLNINMSNQILHKAKPEILRCVEMLIDKLPIEMSELLVEVQRV